ncbi:hypothetical protein ACHAQA_003325 [Verticillium albo-atrum]
MVNLLKVAFVANVFLAQLAVAATKEEVVANFPPAENLSDKGFDLAYYDPESHKVVHEVVDGISKRSSYGDPVLDLIRSHRPEKFCRSYCPGQCAPPKPYTTTIKSTTTAVRTTTATVCPHGCKTTVKATVTAPRPVATVTKPSTTILTVSSTITADTITTEVTSTDTSTVTQTSTTTTVTQTLALGETSVAVPRGLFERGVKAPSYLRRYSRQQICNACAKVYPPPRRPTQTVRKTVTATRSVTATVTRSPSATITQLRTVTPNPTTLTRTTPTTVTTVALETTTPVATKTITVTTTVTTVEAATATTTVCPGIVPANGIGVNPGGRLEFPGGQNGLDCCLACYNSPGCNAWAYIGICAISINAPSTGPATPSTECPAGKGDAFLLTGQAGDNALVGGPGQCSDRGPTVQ